MKKESFLILIGSLKKGGAERNAAILANHLATQGHTVTIALFIKTFAFPLDERVNIVQINHKRYGNGLANALYVIAKLRGLVNTLKPKRLIAMSRIGGLLASCVGFGKTSVRFDSYPLVGYKKYKQWQFWFFYNLPWVKYVVCPSQELKEDVSPYFIRKKKLVAIYNPIQIPDASLADAEVTGSRPYFLIVSRLTGQKNIHRVIDTYFRFKLHEQVDLTVVGDGPEMENLKAQVAKLGLEHCVHLKGFIANPFPYMQNALVLLNASLREAFPNVLIESLSLGTPVISSNAKTGPKEIIFEGENGLLFPAGDYEKMGEAMVQVLANHDLYLHLKKNVARGLDRFAREKVMSSWEKILMEN